MGGFHRNDEAHHCSSISRPALRSCVTHSGNPAPAPALPPPSSSPHRAHQRSLTPWGTALQNSQNVGSRARVWTCKAGPFQGGAPLTTQTGTSEGLISRVDKADVPFLLHQELRTENSCPLLSSLKTPELSGQKFSTARSFFNFTSPEESKEVERHLGLHNGQSERSMITG